MSYHLDGTVNDRGHEDLAADSGGQPRRTTPPGKSTLTSRLAASPASIARAVVAQLRAAENGGAPPSNPADVVQARGDLAGPDVRAVAAEGTAGAGGPLPFLDEIQRAFGHHDVSGVRAHVGGAATDAAERIGAVAYAAGDDVAFARSPDLHLAAHEAAHVVQQRGGVRLSDGVGRAGDEYERHADAVADAVVRGESAQALLDPFAHRGSAGGSAVQRRFEAPRNLQGRSSEDLVALARQIDGQLMGGAPEEDRRPMARALIQIYEILQERVNRGEFHPHGANDTSPLAGLLDDLTPFGNLDQWVALSGEQPRVRRQPRQRQNPRPGAQPQPNPPAQPAAQGGETQPASAGDSNLGRSDIAPDNVESSSANDMLTGVGVGLDVIGLIVGELVLAEAALAIIGPIISAASHVIALEEGVQNHERAGRSLGIRSAIAYSLFTNPPPAHIRVPAVRAFYYNSTDMMAERDRITSTGISAGTRIDEAIEGGQTTAAASMNTTIDRCDAELRRRLGRAPTEEQLRELRRQTWQAIADRAGRR